MPDMQGSACERLYQIQLDRRQSTLPAEVSDDAAYERIELTCSNGPAIELASRE